MRTAAALACLAQPVVADSLRCEVAPPCAVGATCADTVHVSFDIDRTQFAPVIDPAEPPRRKVTLVRMGDAQFPAEAIIMGGNRGFWAEGGGGSHVLFMVAADGTAQYIEDRTGVRMEGTCQG